MLKCESAFHKNLPSTELLRSIAKHGNGMTELFAPENPTALLYSITK